MPRKRTTFKGLVKEINLHRERHKIRKRITDARVRKYLRVIHHHNKKYKYPASDHTHKAKGFSAHEINAIAPATEWRGYVKAGRLGLRLTPKGVRALRVQKRR